MHIKKLGSESVGFHLTEVFDAETFELLSIYCDDFLPLQVRSGGEHGICKRESVILPPDLTETIKTQWFGQISQYFTTSVGLTMELWRDFSGYQNTLHVDGSLVNHVILVYLNDGPDSTENLGTEFHESNGSRHVVHNKANQGLLLLKSDQIPHGMVGAVPDGHVRKVFYINIQNG